MKKMIFIILIGFAVLSNAETNHNAVLICGTTVDIAKSSKYMLWDGGREAGKSRNEFWNDVFLMWEILYANQRCSLYVPEGTPPSDKHLYDHISVLYGDGEDYSSPNPRYQPTYLYEVMSITDDKGSTDGVTSTFENLAAEMTNQDNLFVWTFDHGTTGRCFRRVSVSDPSNPIEVGRYFFPPSRHPEVSICVRGDYAYVTRGYEGLDIIRISSQRRVGHCDIPHFAMSVYVPGVSHPCYAYVVGNSKLSIIDVFIPSEPYLEECCELPGDATDVCLTDDYAYACVSIYRPGGVYVIDLDGAGCDSVGFCRLPGKACGIFVSDTLAYVANDVAINGLNIVKTEGAWGRVLTLDILLTIYWFLEAHGVGLNFNF